MPHTFEIWVAIDEDGDYAVSKESANDAAYKHSEDYPAVALAIYQINFIAPGPIVPVVAITAENNPRLIVTAPQASGSAQLIGRVDENGEDF